MLVGVEGMMLLLLQLVVYVEYTIVHVVWMMVIGCGCWCTAHTCPAEALHVLRTAVVPKWVLQ